ncbi:MAG: hypothetical protein JO013_04910 [Alphaproteobacteria bacterium]|nr:hypothetical protein [Alphaproteobacteria bacterium]
MRVVRSFLAVAALVLPAACSTPRPTIPPPLDIACGLADRAAFLDIQPLVPRQGSTLAIIPRRDNRPAGDILLGSACVSGWTISGPARFTEDHAKIAIDDAAPPGSEIVIGYRVGAMPVERRLRVVARDAVVLTGARSQTNHQACSHTTNVGELEFNAEAFSVTFAPFESYRDYWGTYRFDPATGALVMTVTGGNRVPTGLDLDGRALLEDGHLVLEGMFLGNDDNRPRDEACRYVF